MNAPTQQPDPRTSNGDSVPATVAKRPEVRPEVSIWDLREVKESRSAQSIRGYVQSFAVPGVITAVVLIAYAALRTEGMDNGHKVACAAIAVQALSTLGLAFLLTGAKNHATISKDNPDQSADPGDGGAGA